MKLIMTAIACVLAFFAMSLPAHAEAVSLAIGNIIFSALYTVGVPGALANLVANTALPLALTSASNGAAAILEKGA